MRYNEETLSGDDDDGTMPQNVQELREAVIGHRIASVDVESIRGRDVTVITLDHGIRKVMLAPTSDCCAYTDLETFLLHPDKVNHLILGVGTTDGYTKWHVYAEWGDVLELTVGWSAGNPFYYGYGFDITVEDLPS